MAKPAALMLGFLLRFFVSYSQTTEVLDEPHHSITSADLGTRGIGLTRQQIIGQVTGINFGAGIGHGYNFAADVIGISNWGNCAYLFLNPRFYYNNPPERDGRIHIRPNYFGIQGKFTTGPFFNSSQQVRPTATAEAHFGLQTESNWGLFNYHFGGGYGFDLNSDSGGWYLALGLRIGFVISRKQKINMEE